VICDAYDVVVVPFPFTDRSSSKRRPALVLSAASTFGNPSGHSVLAMITSQGGGSWPLDVLIRDQPEAGLTAPSLVRMKLFTLDHRLILRKAGQLSTRDRSSVAKSIKKLLPAT
jgi:mRNA interferase MazF